MEYLLCVFAVACDIPRTVLKKVSVFRYSLFFAFFYFILVQLYMLVMHNLHITFYIPLTTVDERNFI